MHCNGEPSEVGNGMESYSGATELAHQFELSFELFKPRFDVEASMLVFKSL